MKLTAFLSLALFSGAANAAAAIQWETADILTNPEYATDFSSFPSSSSLAGFQTLDGFTIEQVNGQSNDIWTTYNPGGAGTGRGWYPNGGDNGFTEIRLANGDDFTDVSLFVGSGNGSHDTLIYELLNDTVSVLAGALAGHTTSFQWLSITGGGFDTIRLRDYSMGTATVSDGNHNALAFDRMRAGSTGVPEPMGLALIGIGLAATGVMRARRAA